MFAGTINDGSKKIHAWEKSPDAVFLFEAPNTGKAIPTVIFEAGFSEPYDDLLNDMRQWLLKTKGRVQLVILANIDEDKKARNTLKKTPECSARINQLVKPFGNSQGRARHNEKNPDYDEALEDMDSEASSNQDIYDSIEEAVQTHDWVEPIEASLEFWELGRDPKNGEVG